MLIFILKYSFSNFIGNKDKSLRRSAIMSFRFPISLSGTNVFESNEGGGISLMQSRVDVGGTVLFLNNTAVAGGGLVLEDDSLVIKSVNTVT